VLVRRHPLIHFAVILVVVLATCAPVSSKDNQRSTSPGSGGKSTITLGVVSTPNVLLARPKSVDHPCGVGNSSWDRTPTPPAFPTLTSSSAEDIGPPSPLRFFGRAPAACRPPPQLWNSRSR